ncbi:hypothetical protein ACTFIT_006044 [Dictyostelium discoideum]
MDIKGLQPISFSSFEKYREFLSNPSTLYYPGKILNGEYNFQGPNETVLTLSNLPNEILSPNRIFNWLCQYGNITSIKVGKEQTLVKFCDGFNAYVAHQFANNTFAFGKNINIYWTKYLSLEGIEFNSLNRFKSQERLKNYGASLFRQTQQIYIRNVPINCDEATLYNIFKQFTPYTPINIRLEPDGLNTKLKHGLINFVDIISSTESLIILNNFQFDNHILELIERLNQGLGNFCNNIMDSTTMVQPLTTATASSTTATATATTTTANTTNSSGIINKNFGESLRLSMEEIQLIVLETQKYAIKYHSLLSQQLQQCDDLINIHRGKLVEVQDFLKKMKKRIELVSH